MKFFRQLILFIIVIVLLITFIPRNKIIKKDNNTKEITSYYLTYNNVDIRVNNTFQNYLSVLGNYNDSKESDSQYPGRVYYYDSFQIETYFDGNIEKIKSILFTSNNIYTNEGIGIGDPESYIVKTYNQATVYKNDVYQYELNGTRLTFIVSDEKIISIEYSIT